MVAEPPQEKITDKERLRAIDAQKASLKAAKRMHRITQARKNYMPFVKMMMPDPVDPDDITLSRYKEAHFHTLLAEQLEKIECGKSLRTIITMPPGHGKSCIAAKNYIPWFIGRDPYRHVIFAGYSDTFAENTGAHVRDLMNSQLYKQVFPMSSLLRGSNSKTQLKTSEGGETIFVGVGGMATGRRAHCLKGNTLIETDKGTFSIKDIVMHSVSCRVLSYDHKNNKPTWRSISAFNHSKTNGIFRITTTSGRVVEATGEHPFFTGSFYKTADKLSAGDSILCLVQKRENKTSIRSKQGNSQKWKDSFLLQFFLFDKVSKYFTWENWGSLHNMWKVFSKNINKEDLLRKLQKRVQSNKKNTNQKESSIFKMPSMWSRISKKINAQGLLHSKMCKQCTRTKNDEGWKPNIQKGQHQEKDSSTNAKGFLQNKAINIKKRFSRMCCLWKSKETRSSSHKFESYRSSTSESSDIVPKMSHSFSCFGEIETFLDTVALVERICESTDVFNIQVEELENYFANGVLTHNCLIIDDPIKNREDADSKSFRDGLWDWFNDVAMTRLADFTARVIIIQTRWHEDDLIGRLTDPTNDFYHPEEAKKWEIFHLTALAEENDCIGRNLGEALWPEKFPASMLEDIRRANPKGFASLYQGRPSPEDGDFFKKQWIKTYVPDDMPENLTMYCASDHAVSERQDRDATCLIPFGVDENDNIWIMYDVWWQRSQTPEVVEAMLGLIQKYKPLMWTAENGHISKAIGPFLRKRMNETRTYCAIQDLTPTKSKMARAQAIQGRMSMGKVYFPRFAPWLSTAENELLKFPSAKHDDFVDALAWAGITLGQQVGAPGKSKNEDLEEAVGTIGWMKRSEEWEKRNKEDALKEGY
jgi:predicted phage terminase large subunit-like protein